MESFSIQELSAQASEIIQRVVEDQQGCLVTDAGRPVAVILPFSDDQTDLGERVNEADLSAWDELLQLGKQISENWSSRQSPGEILSNIRR